MFPILFAWKWRKRNVQSFLGTLRGQGLETPCRIHARKVNLPRKRTAYVEFNISAAWKQLPEGIYELSAQGEKKLVQLRDGLWTAA
jgi:hypothetical protein